MGLDAEVTGFMDRVVARVEEARNASLNRFRVCRSLWSTSPWWQDYQPARPQQLPGASLRIRSIQRPNLRRSEPNWCKVNPAPVVTDANVKKQSLRSQFRSLKRPSERVRTQTQKLSKLWNSPSFANQSDERAHSLLSLRR